MAVRFVAVVFVVVLCLAMEGSFACGGLFGCAYESTNRKMLMRSERVLEGFRPLDHDGGGNMVGWDLRRVPSGPDPLHHNRSGPKKPQTP